MTVGGKQLLFILDLNGTVLARLTRRGEQAAMQQHPQFRPPDCSVRGSHVYLRPHLRPFLQALLRLGTVAVWTSALPKNAFPMVLHCFGGLLDLQGLASNGNGASAGSDLSPYLQRHADVAALVGSGPHRLHFLWTQEQCRVGRPSVGGKPEFVKDLDRVWQAFPDYGRRNTIMIDDSEEKLLHHRSNLLRIPEYNVLNPTVDFTRDDALLRLRDYLGELQARHSQSQADFDAQLYLRSHPFVLE